MLKREPAGRADRLRGRRTQCAARVASSTEITACRRVRATGDLCQDLGCPIAGQTLCAHLQQVQVSSV